LVTNPYAYYQKTQIETADRGKLLLMLYDGAYRHIRLSREALNNKDLKEANKSLQHTQKIVLELMSSLDMDSGELARNLLRLYEYMHYMLVQANIKKDTSYLDQVEDMLLDLREAWKQALTAENKTTG